MNKVEDLEYLAFEGGGGKGAVYNGAVLALEELLYKEWIDEKLTLKAKDGSFISATKVQRQEFYSYYLVSNGGFGSREYPSVLDYYNTETQTKVKGISGASAGAITAFPLTLGLTSTDIGEILNKWPFSEAFLPNNRLNEGQYRMMGIGGGGKARFLAAEDDLKKMGAGSVTPYVFNGQPYTGKSQVKAGIRNWAVGQSIKVILAGVYQQMEGLKNTIQKESFFGLVKFVKQAKEKIARVLALLNIFGALGLQQVSQFAVTQGKSFIIRLLKQAGFMSEKKWLGLLPANNLVPAISNIIWDRGIYSAFEVRDFFFKILLMSLSKDTHFKKGLLNQPGLLQELRLSKQDIEQFFYVFGDRLDDVPYQQQHHIFVKLFRLPELLTFKTLYEITGINLCICVTNATTSQPVYFSHYFTPDFPVIEAVGASMSFPVAFKPVYNEANVLVCDIPYLRYSSGFTETADSTPVELFRLAAHRSTGSVYTEVFSTFNFNKFKGVVLSYIKAQYPELDYAVNGNLSFRSFLPWLRRLICRGHFPPFEYAGYTGHKYRYDGVNMKFLCYFYYNSAFKGLLMDGGVTNNLPVSIFSFTNCDGTDSPVQLPAVKKNVLALKLDNSFPQDLKDACFDLLRQDKQGRVAQWFAAAKNRDALLMIADKILQGRNAKRALRQLTADTRATALENLPREAKIKIAQELVKEYQLTAGGFTPWNRQVFIVKAVMDALQFGPDQGQIEDVSDNNHIIPLYCYGLEVFDFDLKADHLKPLVKLAVDESEKAVISKFYPATQTG